MQDAVYTLNQAPLCAAVSPSLGSVVWESRVGRVSALLTSTLNNPLAEFLFPGNFETWLGGLCLQRAVLPQGSVVPLS